MFPANRSRHVMNTEYAFCNVVMRGLRKKERKKDGINYAVNPSKNNAVEEIKKKKTANVEVVETFVKSSGNFVSP